MGMDRDKLISICDKIILFAIYGVAFFIPISKAIIEALSTLAIVFYVIKKILERKNLPKTHLNWALLFYFVICFFSIFFSSNPKISMRTFFGKVLQDIAFFFVVVDTLKGERRIKNFLYILSFSALVLGVDGIYQHFTHRDFIRNRPYYGLPRIHATFPTPNDFACYLVTVIPFVLICIFAKLRLKLVRFLFLGLSILLFICLMFTVSRGAWFAFISAMLFMSIWIRSLAVFFLALGIFIMSTQQFYHPYLKERLSNFFIFEDSSSIDRRLIWQAAWRMFLSRPWIGLGLGTFMFNFKKFVSENYPYTTPYAHNCYLQMGSELGLIGLASFLLILALFFYHGIRALNLNKQRMFFWYVLLASLTATLGYCIQMSVDTIFYSLDLGILFWLLLGLGIAALKDIKKPNSGIAKDYL